MLDENIPYEELRILNPEERRRTLTRPTSRMDKDRKPERTGREREARFITRLRFCHGLLFFI